MKTSLSVFMPFIISGCTAQQLCFTRVEIRNTCPLPLMVTLERHSNLGDERPKSLAIPSGETAIAAEICGLSCDLNASLPNGYRIIFKTNKNQRELERAKVISELIPNHEKSTRDNHYWQLDTHSYCEMADTDQP